MTRTSFTAPTAHGRLGGWVAGEGPEVLVLHGGPGLSYDHLDDALVELLEDFTVASFQQRGLAPSTTEGPFTLDQAVADAVAVLDHLGWQQALLLGHSWGGHLGLHVAVRHPDRLRGMLSVDPLGAVGDGGASAFGSNLAARATPDALAQLSELEQQPPSEQTSIASLTLLWPGYFADPAASPAIPPFRLCPEAGQGLWPEMEAAMADLETALPSITVPVGVVVGELSPMPPDLAGGATAERIPGAWLEEVAGAGHFVWHEQPGILRESLRRLAG